ELRLHSGERRQVRADLREGDVVHPGSGFPHRDARPAGRRDPARPGGIPTGEDLSHRAQLRGGHDVPPSHDELRRAGADPALRLHLHDLDLEEAARGHRGADAIPRAEHAGRGLGRGMIHNPLKSRLNRGELIVLDGALGTELERRGVPTPLPLWSAQALFDSPDTVRSIHQDYVRAGADILTANTFRATPRTLAKAGRAG